MTDDLLRVALAHTPGSVSIYALDSTVVFLNPTTERIMGVRFDEIRGKRLFELYPAAIGSAFHTAFLRVAGGDEAQTFDHYYPELDGWYATRVERVGDHVYVFATEITGEVRLNLRLQSFLAISGRLAGAATVDDIARVLVDEGVRALDASSGALWTLSRQGNELVLVRQIGYRAEHVTAFQRIPVVTDGPIVECLTTGKPVIVTSRAEYVARFPELEGKHRPDPAPPLAFALLPLTIEGRVAGCVNLAFHDERRLTREERTYLELLASHGSEALRRAQIVGELRDVSETRAALIQASPAAITLVDEEGVVLMWNAAAEKMLGRSAQEIVGKTLCLDGTGNNDLRTVLAGHILHGAERRRVRTDGGVVEVELYAAPVRLTDGRTLCLSIALDVTERKRVERGRQLIARATSVFNRSLDWNETLRQFVRLPLDGFAHWCGVDILRADEMLERVSLGPDDSAPMPTLLTHRPSCGGASEAIATGKPVLVRQVDDEFCAKLARNEPHLRALESLHLRSWLSVPMRVGNRIVGALSVAAQDRKFDDLDLAIVVDLATHVASAYDNASLYAEAHAARRDAEQATQAKDQFLAMLGHELRNPLAPMVTALELMRMRDAGYASRERDVIARQVDHLSQLVDDLLDVSRITRGKIELRRERVDLATTVAKAIEQASPLLEQRLHRLFVDVPSDLVVHGDPLRLAQIIANLVSNAAKYTPERGRLDIMGTREGDNVVITVRDNGIGIAPEVLPHVFDLFVQAPQSSARPAGGLGLGLTIVRSLVELHGGKIELHSAGRGSGTLAVVTLPASNNAAQAPRAKMPRVAQAPIAKRILIVDDNEDAAMLLSEMLEAHGHQMRTAFDGPSALRIADEFHPEIAVLDIGLPVMDGYELAQRLRSTSDVKLIALSGYSQESDRARTREAGFQAHLAKPVPIEALMRLVDETP